MGPWVQFKGLKLRFMLDIVLEGVLEASWSDIGTVLGGQDAPQDVPRWHKTAPRRPQDGQRCVPDALKTRSDVSKTAKDGKI